MCRRLRTVLNEYHICFFDYESESDNKPVEAAVEAGGVMAIVIRTLNHFSPRAVEAAVGKIVAVMMIRNNLQRQVSLIVIIRCLFLQPQERIFFGLDHVICNLNLVICPRTSLPVIRSSIISCLALPWSFSNILLPQHALVGDTAC